MTILSEVNGGMIRPNASGKSGIARPEFVWRINAPRISWTYMNAVAAAHNVCSGILSACDLISGKPRFQLGEVKMAIEITRQKNVCARQAWSVEIHAGSINNTLRPPRTPC